MQTGERKISPRAFLENSAALVLSILKTNVEAESIVSRAVKMLCRGLNSVLEFTAKSTSQFSLTMMLNVLK